MRRRLNGWCPRVPEGLSWHPLCPRAAPPLHPTTLLLALSIPSPYCLLHVSPCPTAALLPLRAPPRCLHSSGPHLAVKASDAWVPASCSFPSESGPSQQPQVAAAWLEPHTRVGAQLHPHTPGFRASPTLPCTPRSRSPDAPPCPLPWPRAVSQQAGDVTRNSWCSARRKNVVCCERRVLTVRTAYGDIDEELPMPLSGLP